MILLLHTLLMRHQKSVPCCSATVSCVQSNIDIQGHTVHIVSSRYQQHRLMFEALNSTPGCLYWFWLIKCVELCGCHFRSFKCGTFSAVRTPQTQEGCLNYKRSNCGEINMGVFRLTYKIQMLKFFFNPYLVHLSVKTWSQNLLPICELPVIL